MYGKKTIQKLSEIGGGGGIAGFDKLKQAHHM
jgi:hypothetical protein